MPLSADVLAPNGVISSHSVDNCSLSHLCDRMTSLEMTTGTNEISSIKHKDIIRNNNPENYCTNQSGQVSKGFRISINLHETLPETQDPIQHIRNNCSSTNEFKNR